MYRDEIIAEIRRNRDAYTRQHHHSLTEMVANLQARQKRSGRELADRRERTRAFSGPRSSAPEA